MNIPKPVTIDGIEYLSINDFAVAINRSYPAVYQLVNKGNIQPDGTYAKLKSIKYGPAVYIPVSEILDFTFAETGRNPGFYKYRFNENNELITVER